MTKTAAQKMRIEEGGRALLIHAPRATVAKMKLPRLVRTTRRQGTFDTIFFFTKTAAELNELFPKLKKSLRAQGTLWVAWPKGKQLGTDLALPKVIELSYDHGLVESTCLSVDETWSALKLTRPKKGKVYNNSYGTLRHEQL